MLAFVLAELGSLAYIGISSDVLFYELPVEEEFEGPADDAESVAAKL